MTSSPVDGILPVLEPPDDPDSDGPPIAGAEGARVTPLTSSA